MPNYEFKSYILNELPDSLIAVKNTRKFGYLLNEIKTKHNSDEVWSPRLSQLEPYVELARQLKPSILTECDLIINADKKRRQRLRSRITSMFVSGSCYFVTLTFNDAYLEKTTPKERRVAVTRFLKNVSFSYVGNIDFGDKGGREHYHAIIRSDDLNDIQYHYFNRFGWICDECTQFSSWSKNGFYTIKSCNKDETDIKKLSAYVTKLTNHAIKETTRRSSLIYSR